MVHLQQRPHLRIANFIFDYFSISLTTVLALSCLMCGCARHEVSTAATAKPLPADQPTAKVVQPPAPTVAEVNEAVTRVFKNAAALDSKHEPNFLAGDFNGDASQDIAVILQPANGKLAEMNQEFAPWILKDPFANPNRPAPLRIVANELLLAIIHGYGPNGWHDVQATQTYLLKNAVGLDVRAFPKSDFAGANQGKKLPRLMGDLIGENLGGRSGYLYFNGAQYSWYDPKIFAGEPEIRLTHPGMTARKKFDLLHPNLVAAEK
ncbi:MAG TPA: hypothetical protein VLN44_08300 [Pyrinomonadaceae bacterium]|nr:hypothetical protein [Pyrinomonadaceae bacterium]